MVPKQDLVATCMEKQNSPTRVGLSREKNCSLPARQVRVGPGSGRNSGLFLHAGKTFSQDPDPPVQLTLLLVDGRITGWLGSCGHFRPKAVTQGIVRTLERPRESSLSRLKQPNRHPYLQGRLIMPDIGSRIPEWIALRPIWPLTFSGPVSHDAKALRKIDIDQLLRVWAIPGCLLAT